MVAPGESLKSTIGTDAYESKSGTSQAAPIVSATAAILFSANNNMTITEFKNYIIDCSEPIADEYCGYGLLNIEAMFKESIKNNNYYLSPINSDGIIIYNNTNATTSATAIFAEYDENNRYTGGNIKPISIEDGAFKKVYFEETQNKLKFFLWDSLDTLIPLTQSRERGVP